MSRTISVSYTLSPPDNVEAPSGYATSVQKSYTIKEGTNNKELCDALHEAVEEARNDIGKDLTAWRDAVGNKEARKEPRKNRRQEEE
jgi:hypothetical protein